MFVATLRFVVLQNGRRREKLVKLRIVYCLECCNIEISKTHTFTYTYIYTYIFENKTFESLLLLPPFVCFDYVFEVVMIMFLCVLLIG